MDDDLFITKVVKPKKSMKWVASSFDDFANAPPCKQTQSLEESVSASIPSRKRGREQSSLKKFLSKEPVHRLTTVVKGKHKDKKLKDVLNSDLWSDQLEPKSKGDLAVHKKKVEDVETWLRNKTTHFTKNSAPILLLTGPAGAGKTATVRVLSKELNLEVQEWVNPVQPVYSSEPFMSDSFRPYEYSRVDQCRSESQLVQFQSFLLRANKYHSLEMAGSSSSAEKIIFIEELPNLFFRDNSAFHDVLRKYRLVGRCPLVFIISDTTSGTSSERHLFPADLQDELRIDNISFNPVAPSMMIKVLTRIGSTAASTASPSASVIESIALSSAGDVRSAVNALQFACCQDTCDLNKKLQLSKSNSKTGSSGSRKLKYQKSAKKDAVSAQQLSIGSRDTSCFLFHAIGKILYAKRDDVCNVPDHPRLPPHLKEHDRDPLIICPEEVVDKSHLSGDYFTSFLHQNYVDFFPELADVVRASEYMSDADFFTADWELRSCMQDYAVSISSRGVIHCNTAFGTHDPQRKGPGWKPLHKSQWFGVQKTCRLNTQTASSLFKGFHCEPNVLKTEVIPYMNLINITLHSPGQISFVQEMSKFLKIGKLARSEKLDEKEVLTVEDEEAASIPQSTSVAKQKDEAREVPVCEEVSNSQNEIKSTAEEDEEIFIDEFDD